MTRHFFLLLALVCSAQAQALHLTTLNCTWLYRPDLARVVLPKEAPATLDEYRIKTHNLASVLLDIPPQNSRLFAFEGIGGPSEATDMAQAVRATEAGFRSLPPPGPAQDTGAALSGGDWRMQSVTVLPGLAGIRHLWVQLHSSAGRTIYCLILHLAPSPLRPAEGREEAARIESAMREAYAADPRSGIVILGDTNAPTPPFSGLMVGGWVDGTHLRHVPTTCPGLLMVVDRIVCSPNLRFTECLVTPFPPTATIDRAWSTHLPVSATVEFAD